MNVLGLLILMTVTTLGSLGCSTPADSTPADPQWKLSEFEQAFQNWIDTYTLQGSIDYAKAAKSPEALKQLVAYLYHTDPLLLTRAERKAFFINSYNICMLQQVFAELPANPDYSSFSVMQIPGIFTEPRCKFKNLSLSLDTMEKTVLIEGYEDPRIHFALNCASSSCPPLLEAIQTSRIHQQLERLTHNFLRNDIQLNEDGQMKVSRIFRWYAEDFQVQGSLSKGMAKLAGPKTQALLQKTESFVFKPYDWTLNATQNTQSP